MNIYTKYPIMIFRNEYNGKVFYNAGLSNKKEDGSYENASIGINLPKGTNLESKSKIQIKDGFLKFYKKGEEGSYDVVFTIQVLDYEIVEGGEAKPIIETNNQVEEDPFVAFGNEVEIDPDDLPF